MYGKSPDKENHPEYIKEALLQGYQVEVDVWYTDGQYFLGHDEPQYIVDESFLSNNNLWCHAKNKDALFEMRKSSNIHFFWHQTDDYTLTSEGYVWTYPGKETTVGSIIVCGKEIPEGEYSGFCSDYVGVINDC